MSADSGQGVDLRQQYRRSSRRWQEALLASADAPPDAGFVQRLRDIATAANQQSTVFNLLATSPLSWRPRPGARAMELSYELRPGAQSRPGSPELWQRFDRAVESLGDAYEGVSLAEIGHAFGLLAKVAHEIADSLEDAGYGRERPAMRLSR